jgi:putative redox protein
MSESEKTYSNGEITVIWNPGACIHSARCVQGLGEVFNVSARPWINMDGSVSDRIIKQVDQCPSGALTYFRNEKISEAAG